jgi:hypothetical protein
MHLHPDQILDIHHSRTDRFRRRPVPDSTPSARPRRRRR